VTLNEGIVGDVDVRAGGVYTVVINEDIPGEDVRFYFSINLWQC